MEISSVLSFMRLEYTIWGNSSYNENIDLSEINIKCDNLPSNEEFHKQAKLLKQKIEEDALELKTRPSVDEKIDAIFNQIKFICAKGGFNHCISFEELDKKIKNKK